MKQSNELIKINNTTKKNFKLLPAAIQVWP